MQPRKTDQAHAALQTHRAGLDMRQRRVLILADGQRSLDELTGILGADTPQQVTDLIRGGYLTLDREATLHEVLARQPAPPPITTPVAVAPAPPLRAAPAHRRSMVAARLYLLGMLELQRHPEAQRLHRQLQRAIEDQPALDTMLEAMHALPALTSAGYAQRVLGRLREVLPEDFLGALDGIALPTEA